MTASTIVETESSASVTKYAPERTALMRGLVGFLVFLAIVEAVTRAGIVHPAYLPPATRILGQTVLLFGDGGFLSHVAATVEATLLGLALSIGVGAPLGIVLGSWAWLYRASRSLVEVIRPIPSVALIPVMILIFGSGTNMKVAIVVTGAVWPILFNTIYGVHNVDPVAQDTARSFGYGPVRVLVRVSLPSALPFMYTGVRIAAAIALIITISAEIIAGSPSGLGSWLMLMRATGRDPALVFAGTVVAGLLGWAMNVCLRAIQVRFLSWDASSRKGEVL